MRRVLLTVHKFFPDHRAGTEVLTLKVAQELNARGYKTLVVTADPPDQDARHSSGEDFSDFTYEGVDVHVVREPLRLRGYTFRHEFDHPLIGAHFREIIAKFKPDLVHIFHAQNLSSEIVKQAKDADLPVVASLTDFWFVCPVVQLKRPDGQLCRGPKNLATNCLTCYTPELFPPISEISEAIERKLPAVGRILAKLPTILRNATLGAASNTYIASKLPSAVAATMQRPAHLRQSANAIDAIMVPTKLMQDIFVENGIQPERIMKVPFGLDTEPLEPYRTKTQSEQIRVGFIGTIFEHKGLDLLISAFHRLSPTTNAILKIYGDPEQFPEYGKKMQSLAASGQNAAKIEFLGTFPNTRLGEVLQNLDVLVVPSRWYENTPLVIQSAFATGTPVMATDLGGMSELVNHDVNGLLFQVNDIESLRCQLVRIIEDKDLLPVLRKNIGPERTVRQMVDDIEAVYERVLNRRDAKPAGGANVAGAAMLS
jgi:glycosyltransferase involved in cell wall biosynthesis